jgi:hypothetical protein
VEEFSTTMRCALVVNTLATHEILKRIRDQKNPGAGKRDVRCTEKLK